MRRFRDLDKNLRFLVIEVTKQVERAEQLLGGPDEVLRRRLLRRDDYVDQLKATIGNKCFSHLHELDDLHKKSVDLIRSILVINTNLEHIADHAVDIADQIDRFNDQSFIQRYDYRAFFALVTEALSLVTDAVHAGDTAAAIRIARVEPELDRLYTEKYERILAELASGENAADLISSLNIFGLLEQMGDSLLNIAEAILLFKTGEKLKLRQYEDLVTALGPTADGAQSGEFEYQGIWGTRSGCRIGKVSSSNGHETVRTNGEVIYKEGHREKIDAERRMIEKWRHLRPNIPPRIVEYSENGEGASLLVEYLAGRNLQEVVLGTDEEMFSEALEVLQATLVDLWDSTRTDEPVRARFLEELADRVGEVYRTHPSFNGHRKQVSGLEIPNLPALLDRTLPLDDLLVAPFSVLCHGDFNLDNIIYDPAARRVHFIDLHRSRLTDYVRDVAVFLVSGYRLPVFDWGLRARLNAAIGRFFEFALDYAERSGDETFEARLASGLARSFASSTRFELDRAFAEDMLYRARYLLEQLSDYEEIDLAHYTLPREVLFY